MQLRINAGLYTLEDILSIFDKTLNQYLPSTLSDRSVEERYKKKIMHFLIYIYVTYFYSLDVM